MTTLDLGGERQTSMNPYNACFDECVATIDEICLKNGKMLDKTRKVSLHTDRNRRHFRTVHCVRLAGVFGQKGVF